MPEGDIQCTTGTSFEGLCLVDAVGIKHSAMKYLAGRAGDGKAAKQFWAYKDSQAAVGEAADTVIQI